MNRRPRGTARCFRLLPLLLAFFLLLSGGVCAEEDSGGEEDFQRLYDELAGQSGADGLFSLLPEEPRELLRENGISGVDPDAILNLSFWDLLRGGWAGVKAAAARPLSALAVSVGAILLCALLDSLKSSVGGEGNARLFSVVSVLCVSSAVIAPIARMITETAALLEEMSGFLLSFIPVYTGIVTASGRPVSGAVCNACLLGAAEVISRLAATVLVPLLAVYMAICLIGAASREIDMQSIAKLVRNVVVTALSFLLTIFVGLLSVQGTVAAAADTVASKTVKFAVGSFVPVVGGALSDAFSSVQGCVGVLRSAVGGFGILAIAAAFLPQILSILLMQLSLGVAGGAADALGVKEAGGLMRSASSVLSVLLGILLVFGMLFIVSLSLMMALSSGGQA